MRMDSGMGDTPVLLAVTVIIAIAGSVTLLWAVPRLHGVWPTAVAALITGAVVSGLHYTGMAGMHLRPTSMSGMSNGMPVAGATAGSFLLPLIIGISIAAFVLAAILALSPSVEEIHAEEQLMARIGRHRVGQHRMGQPPGGQPRGGPSPRDPSPGGQPPRGPSPGGQPPRLTARS
jgi:hypothetical protein